VFEWVLILFLVVEVLPSNKMSRVTSNRIL
jgi:hypothetical protein